MTPKRTTRSTTTTATSMTDEQLKAPIAHGVTDVLAECEATKSRNGKDSNDSGMGDGNYVPNKQLHCENQIKFATCTLLGSALTWWNSHVRTVGHDVAYAMTWTNLKKNMTDKYYLRGEIKKLEVELWNLKVKGTDVVSYGQHFQELTLMCARMFPEESDKIEKYVGGFPDMIHGSVMASKPKTMQDAIEFATKLMDKKINTFVEWQAESKMKSLVNANTANKQRGTGAGQKATCYECGAQGHFKRDCPKLKNNNQGNPAGNGNALVKVYVVGNVGTNPNSNVITGTFLLNNRYASILFDTGANRSFVSTAFSS
ncbi:reverse transcriptase domain-containing protein [Tanacetum coccineum]